MQPSGATEIRRPTKPKNGSAGQGDGGQTSSDRLDRLARHGAGPPVRRAMVELASGRSVELAAGRLRDRLLVRDRAGKVLLKVEVGDRGPLLEFEAAEIELRATRSLALKAERVSVEASAQLELVSRGAMCERVDGHHHLRVGGDERVEAARIEMQANDEAVRVRAMEHITLDGEHIGLNDDPYPRPFPWSQLEVERERT